MINFTTVHFEELFLLAPREQRKLKMTTVFQAKQHVNVKDSTAVAEFVELLENGHAKIKWLEKGDGQWPTQYPVDQLTALPKRRERRPPRHLREEEVPTNKKRMKLDQKKDNDDSNQKKENRTKGKMGHDDDITVATELTADETVTSMENINSRVAKARNDETSDSELNKVSESVANNEHEEMSIESDAKPAAKTYSKAPDLWQVIGLEKDEGLKQVAKLLPKGSKKCAKEVIHFFLFCYERQMVWERRNRDERVGEGYYTESWAMQTYFFCNVSTREAFVCMYIQQFLTIASYILYIELSRTRSRNMLLSRADSKALGQAPNRWSCKPPNMD